MEAGRVRYFIVSNHVNMGNKEFTTSRRAECDVIILLGVAVFEDININLCLSRLLGVANIKCLKV